MNTQDILKRIYEQKLKKGEKLNLPVPGKQSTDYFNGNLTIEEIALRQPFIKDAVVNCSRNDKALEYELGYVNQRVKELEEEKVDCAKREKQNKLELIKIETKKENYEKKAKNLDVQEAESESDINLITQQKAKENERIHELQQEHIRLLAKEQEIEVEEVQKAKEIEETENKLVDAQQSQIALQNAVKKLEELTNQGVLEESRVEEAKSKLEMELYDLQETIRMLDQTIQDLKSRVIESKNNVQRLAKEIEDTEEAKLNEENNKLLEQNRAETLETIKSSLEEEKNTMVTEASALQQTISKEEIELSQIVDTHRVINGGKNSSDRVETISREGERQSKRAKISSLRSRMDALNNKVNSHQNEIRRLIGEIGQAKGKVQVHENKIAYWAMKINTKTTEKNIAEASLNTDKELLNKKQQEKSGQEKNAMSKKETHRLLSTNIQNIKLHLENLRNKKVAEETKESKLKENMAQLQAKHQSIAEALNQCQNDKKQIKQKISNSSTSVIDKTNQLNKLDIQKSYLQSKKTDIANDIHFYEDSLHHLNQEKNAMNEFHNNLELHHQIYANILQPELKKGLEIRKANELEIRKAKQVTDENQNLNARIDLGFNLVKK